MDSLSPEAIFGRIYDESCQAVHAYLLGRTGEPEAALDLLQETFLRAWRHLHVLQSLTPDRRRYWLFAVARNVLTDSYRKEASRQASQQEYAHCLSRGDSEGSPDPGRNLEAREENGASRPRHQASARGSADGAPDASPGRNVQH